MPVLPPPTRPSPLLALGEGAFRLASRLRGERAVHARGRTFTGRVRVPGGAGTGASLLDEAGDHEALVRLSRSVGLPSSLPDVFGLALRLLDAAGPGRHVDLLLDSTLPAPLLRRLPCPGLRPTAQSYGSLLPYDVGGTRVLLGARATADTRRATADVRALEDLPEHLELDLLLATRHGPWREVARTTTTGELPAPLGRQTRFTPAMSGRGVAAAGPLQAWRERAYPASHVAADER